MPETPTTILTVTKFFDCGIPTATDLSETEVSFGIRTVEQFIVKPRLGDIYADIVAAPTEYAAVISGSAHLAGLDCAIEHLVFAYMLYDKIRLTRYSSVVKNDEHSTDPSLTDTRKIASAHWEIGLSFLDEVCEFLQCPKPEHPLNNVIFGELIG